MNLKKQLIQLARKSREEKPMWFGNRKPVHLENMTVEILDCFKDSRYNSQEEAVQVFLA
jgi:hypothetical protein